MKKKSIFPTNLIFISTGIIFILLALNMVISNSIIMFLSKRGILLSPPGTSLLPFLIQTGIISILCGTILTLCIGHLPLRPIHTLIKAIHAVSKGDFQTKIYIEHPQEFRELSSCFNQMTEELAGIEMLRSDFINNFSHEFKTPIVSILGFAKLLKKGDLTPAEQTEYLDIIIEESDRLVTLSTNVLNLSKVESMSLLTGFSTFNLAEQLRECVVLLESKWNEKNISFNFDLEEIQVNGNEPLLKQVWVNLLDNAIKFSPVNGEITLSLSGDDESVNATLKDYGPGMDENTCHCIFDKFYQGDPSHASEGNGLGLSLVKKIVELHHGNVTVESHVGEGSTFIVALPREKHDLETRKNGSL